jgi:hypothetical protein
LTMPRSLETAHDCSDLAPQGCGLSFTLSLFPRKVRLG